MWIRTILVAMICLASTIGVATAQTYPSRPIRIVVAYPPGGSTDLMARLVAQKMTSTLGQPVIVENKPGATGRLGTTFVAKAEPDGYTLLFTNAGPGAVSHALYKDSAYDPVADFAPIATVANMPLVLAVSGTSRIGTVADLVAAAKASPGKLNYATTGNGSVSHIATELFNALAGIKATQVPYKGGAQTAPAVISGEVDFFFSVPSDILPHVKAGRMKALAIATAKRSPIAPEVPTAAEAGLPGFEVDLWYGLLAPAHTPRAVVERLSREVARALQQPDVSGKIVALASEPMMMGPEQFHAAIRKDVEKWTRVIRESGITAN